MKKYIVTVNWNHGFTHEYEVIGGDIGSRSDAVQDAKDHLNAARNISSYTIKDEDGSVVYEHRRD
jgi:hypothetical protein